MQVQRIQVHGPRSSGPPPRGHRGPIAPPWVAVVILLTLVVSGGFVSEAASPAEVTPYWEDRFAEVSTDPSASISSIAQLSDGRWVMGGRFRGFQGSPNIENLAVLEGRKGINIGRVLDSTTSGSKAVSVVLADGTGLYVGGSFNTVGGITRRHVAHWDGTNWSSLGSGVGGSLETVEAMARANGSLFVGGRFSTAGGRCATNVAVWNGGQWSALGNGLRDAVWAMVFHAGAIHAAALGTDTVPVVHRWNGVAWDRLEGDLPRVVANPRRVVLASAGEDLLLGLAGVSTNETALFRRSGATWSPVSMRIQGSTNAPHSFASVAAITVQDGRLWIAGRLGPGIATGGDRLFRRDGEAWMEVSLEADVEVSGIHAGRDALLLAGRFSDVVRTRKPGMVLIRGGEIGDRYGITPPPPTFELGDYNPLVTVPGAGLVYHSRLGNLFDPFTRSNQTAAAARWDGTRWRAFDPSLATIPSLFSITWAPALAMQGGELVLANSMNSQRPSDRTRFVKWTQDGTQPLGGPELDSVTEGFEVVVTRGREVFAAGAAGVIRWNGSQWVPLGNLTPWHARALAVDRTNVYAVGSTSTWGTNGIVRRWDGVRWHTLASDGDASVDSAVLRGGRLVVGGRFTRLGGIDVRGVARWDGTAWRSEGVGLPASSRSVRLAVDGEQRLFAGGWFAPNGNPGAEVLYMQAPDGQWTSTGARSASGIAGIAWWRNGLHAIGNFSADGVVSEGFGIWRDPAVELWFEADLPREVRPRARVATRLEVRRLGTNEFGRWTAAQLSLPLPSGWEWGPGVSETALTAEMNEALAATNLWRVDAELVAPSDPATAAFGEWTVRSGSGRAYTASPLFVTVDPGDLPPTAVFTLPAGSTEFSQADVIGLEAAVSDREGDVGSVAFLDGEATLTTLVEPPFRFAWSNALPGAHVLRVVATDRAGQSTESFPRTLRVFGRPPNDRLSDRVLLPAHGGVVAGTTLDATAGDRVEVLGRSVWYEWRPDRSGLALVSCSPTPANRSTVVFQLNGDEFTFRARVERGGGNPSPPVVPAIPTAAFEVVPGQVFIIGVGDEPSSAEGAFRLSISHFEAAPNDRFSSASPLFPLGQAEFVELAGHTAEPSEPMHAGAPAYASAWFRWTAPANGMLQVECGNPGMRSALYRGGGIAELTPIPEVTPGSRRYPVGRDVQYAFVLDATSNATSNGYVTALFFRQEPRLDWTSTREEPAVLRLSLPTNEIGSYILQQSEDLQRWEPLGTNSPNLFPYVIPPSHHRRFWRLVPTFP